MKPDDLIGYVITSQRQPFWRQVVAMPPAWRVRLGELDWHIRNVRPDYAVPLSAEK